MELIQYILGGGLLAFGFIWTFFFILSFGGSTLPMLFMGPILFVTGYFILPIEFSHWVWLIFLFDIVGWFTLFTEPSRLIEDYTIWFKPSSYRPVRSRSQTQQRTTDLMTLLAARAPVHQARAKLQTYNWDSDPLVTLEPDHIIAVLAKFQQGEWQAFDVEEWAGAIEGRDDIDIPKTSEPSLVDMIHQLANPVLEGPLTQETAAELLDELKRAAQSNP